MIKKFQNITRKLWSVSALITLILIWQFISATGIVEEFMLPAPIDVIKAFINEFPTLMEHCAVTLKEAVIGLMAGIVIGFVTAVVMDSFLCMYKAVYPLLIITQTIPTVAIAPLLVLWFGYDMTPKIILVIITTFFPVAVGLLNGFKSADKDSINLLRAMGGNGWQIFIHIKLPGALPQFFSALRISASYSVVGAVISEWLGGFNGLGVYMTRVKKAFSFDKMFAVILLISILSLLLMKIVDIVHKKCMPWEKNIQELSIKEKREVMNKMINLKKIQKKIMAFIMTIIMLLSFSGCDNNKEKQKSGGLIKVTFVLDWTPNTNHTGLYVADKLGYFEEAGIEVEIVQPPEDGAEVMVASGKAQFGVSFQDTMAPALAGDNPLPITAVAAIVQHNTSGIISRKGEGMETPKGMEGHSYSTWNGPIELATLEQVVATDGGDFSKISLIPSTVTDEVSALKTKSTDSIWIFYGWAGIKMELSGLETDYFAFADINPVFDYYTPVVIAGDEFLEENPETAKAFLEALGKGYEYAIENPDEAAKILCESVAELDEELVLASQRYLSQQYKSEVTKWGYIDADRWNNFYNWVNDNNLVETPIPENTGFSNEYLP